MDESEAIISNYNKRVKEIASSIPSDWPFQIDSAVLCDLSRREDSGKYLLIGIYLGFIGISALPTDLRLTLWLGVIPNTSGKFSAGVRVIKNDDVLAEGKFQIELRGEYSAIDLKDIPLRLQGFGRIAFQIKIGEGVWTTVKEIKVAKYLLQKKGELN